MSFSDSMASTGFILLIFLMKFWANQGEAEEIKEMVDKAVDNVVPDFVKMEERIGTVENRFGY